MRPIAKRPSVLFSVVLFVTLTVGCPLFASDVQGSGALYESAKEDLKAERTTLALEKFKRAMKLADDDIIARWRSMLGIALAYESLGQAEAALEYYRRFGDAFDTYPGVVEERWRKRRAVAEEKVDALEAKILVKNGLVEVASTPAGARVLVEGSAWGADGDASTPFVLCLKPGQWTVTVDLDGYEPTKTTLSVQAGTRQSKSFALKAQAVAKPLGKIVVTKKPPVASPSPPREPQVDLRKETKHAGPRPLWGWIAAGTGVAMLGAGVPFSLMAKSDRDSMGDLDPASNEYDYVNRYRGLDASRKGNQTLSLVLFGVGGAAIVGGVVYLAAFADWSGGQQGDARSAKQQAPFFGLIPVSGGAVMMTGWRW